MSLVIFENSGELDPRLIRSFGVNVKEGEGAIGFFGTGLKYALAILARTEHGVTIQSGAATFEFSLAPAEIRGKAFEFIAMNGEPLGFTTELGKTWKLWMAYRELFCNCQDESGHVYEADAVPAPEPGKTRVIVRGREFLAVRHEHDSYFLAGPPLWQGHGLAVHSGLGSTFYYRNVMVAPVKNGVSLYRYNVLDDLDLTEDRTARCAWDIPHKVGRSLVRCDDPEILRVAVTASQGAFERQVDFDWESLTPSEAFLKVVGELVRDKMVLVNPSAIKMYERHARTVAEPARAALTEVERMMLARALAFCQRFGFDIRHEIVPVEVIGPSVLGMARDKRIYVAREAFSMGTKIVAGTLIEEHLHLKHELRDCTRQMQEFLLNRLVSAGEQIMGEPL